MVSPAPIELPQDASIDLLRDTLRRMIIANDGGKKQAWFTLQRKYILARLEFLIACQRDASTAAMAKKIALSDDGFWFFCRMFGTIVEPRPQMEQSGYLPFIPFLHQEWAANFFFKAYEDGKMVLALKTRDMGISWMTYHQLVWMWLRAEDSSWAALLGNRNEDIVDKSAGKLDKNTMFGRMEIIVSHLPKWMQPRGFNLSDEGQRMKKWWRNPENGATFEGEGNIASFGRNGRYAVGFMDELEFWNDPVSAISAIRDSCGAIWLITTPNLQGAQVAKRLVDEARVRVLDLPWYYHPYKDQAWYDEQVEERFAESLASEVQASWDGGDHLLIYPEWDRVPKGDFAFRPDWPMQIGMDWGRSDAAAMTWTQHSRLTGRWRILASLSRSGEDITHFLPYLGGPMVDDSANYNQWEMALIGKARTWRRVGQYGVEMYGDPAGRQKTMVSNQSVLDILAKNNINVLTNTASVSHEARQTALHQMLRQADCNIEDCAVLDWSMKRYKRRALSAASVTERNTRGSHQYSHGPASLEYIAVNVDTLRDLRSGPDEAPERHVAAWEKR